MKNQISIVNKIYIVLFFFHHHIGIIQQDEAVKNKKYKKNKKLNVIFFSFWSLKFRSLPERGVVSNFFPTDKMSSLLMKQKFS